MELRSRHLSDSRVSLKTAIAAFIRLFDRTTIGGVEHTLAPPTVADPTMLHRNDPYKDLDPPTPHWGC
jgi:hypothetical protein